MNNTKRSMAFVLAFMLATASVAVIGFNASASAQAVAEHNKNCDVQTFLAPDSEIVVQITDILQNNTSVVETVTQNTTVIQNATEIVNENTQVVDEVASEVADQTNSTNLPTNTTVSDSIEILVNQTAVQDVAQQVVSEAIVDVVQSGEELSVETVNASAMVIVNDNVTVTNIANETATDLNASELADQVATTVEQNPDAVQEAVSDVFTVNQPDEQATTVIHMKTDGLPEGRFTLNAEDGTTISDFNIKVPGGIQAGDYIVTIQPATPEETSQIIEEAQQEGNTTGTLTTNNQTSDNQTGSQ